MANGYVPSSGVWTAEERALFLEVMPGLRAYRQKAIERHRIVDTVSALITALEDVIPAAAWAEEYKEKVSNARQLLDSLK